MLPWKQIPRWLRVARALLLVAWVVLMATLCAGWGLYNEAISSPEFAQGPFRNREEVKGVTRYLTDQLDQVYKLHNLLVPYLWGVAMILMMINLTAERRIRNRLWQAELAAIVDRRDADDGRS